MNFAAFDLNLLRVFDALMRERSATRAGENIGLSQPAVSNALKRLRLTIGDDLFVHDGNHMVPTARAEAIAGPIRDALANVERALSSVEQFDPAEADGLFTLYGADFFSTLAVPPLFSRISATAPGISLRLLESATGGVESLLRDDVIDAALERAMPVPDWVSSMPVLHSHYLVIAAKGHKEIGEAGIRPGDRLPLDLFCSLPHALRSSDGSMSGIVDDALHQSGHARKVVLALPHFHSVAVAVSQSGLVATLPDQIVAFAAGGLDIDFFRPPVELAVQELHLYWHSRNNDHPAHCWLRQQILDTLASL